MMFLALTLVASPVVDPGPAKPAIAPPVEAHYREVLLDFESARIERVKAPYPDIWKVRCGLLARDCTKGSYPALLHCYRVNAKNAYGGYTGWVYYWLVEINGRVFASGDDRYGVERYCGFDPGASQN
jgi:hypothetical protein